MAISMDVIGLHAVQLGNNEDEKKFRGQPHLTWLSEEFFEYDYCQIKQECSPLAY